METLYHCRQPYQPTGKEIGKMEVYERKTDKLSLLISGRRMNWTTYRSTHTGKNARIATCNPPQNHVSRPKCGRKFALLSLQIAPKNLLTSNAYPNSKPSFPSPPPNSPLALLFPGKPLTPGPSNRPTRKYAVVAAKRLKTRKWTNMKIKVNRIVAATDEV